MTWETIISFTDKNTPLRFKVATSKAPDQPGENGTSWYNIMADELNELDNKIAGFDFVYNIKDNRYDPTNTGKPLLLITEQMVEEVKKGKENGN